MMKRGKQKIFNWSVYHQSMKGLKTKHFKARVNINFRQELKCILNLLLAAKTLAGGCGRVGMVGDNHVLTLRVQ
jgi:hypothetical protein